MLATSTHVPSFLSSMIVALAVILLGLVVFVSVVAFDHIYTMHEKQEWQRQHPDQISWWQATMYETYCYKWRMTMAEAKWEVSKMLYRHP